MNPASPFQLGDVAEVIEDGHRIKITQLYKNDDGSIGYSALGEPLYHASSLRKVEELHVGDYAKVILPDCAVVGKIGRIIQIDETTGLIQSDVDGGWWRSTSLQKVDGPQLRVGDWVRIIDTNSRSFDLIFQITCQTDGMFTGEEVDFFLPAKSLRKLTPEEVAKHLTKDLPGTSTEGMIMERLSAIESRIEKSPIGCHEDLHEQLDERLSAIEQRQESQVAANSKLRRRCHEAEQRLASLEEFARDAEQYMQFLEKWQMEHDLERTSRFPKDEANSCDDWGNPIQLSASIHTDDMIADGTLEVSDFRKKDVRSQRRIIRQLEEELIDGYEGAVCEECEEAADSRVDLSVDDRKEALVYAIRKLRMPDVNDPRLKPVGLSFQFSFGGWFPERRPCGNGRQ